MTTATGRSPEERLPRQVSEGSEAPEFPVTFSRRPESGGRAETGPNSFRWVGKGTIRLMERGLLVIAKRRLPIGFHTTEQRFVPAWEICDVYREGNSVRVGLRGDPRNRDFFQFWTGDAATAGTVVRLLPTERTIEVEYEEPPATPKAERSAPAQSSPASRAHALIAIALAVAVISTATIITVIKLRSRPGEPATPGASVIPGATVTTTARQPAVALPRVTTAGVPRHATDVEVATLHRFDEHMNGLRAEFNLAFSALQHGDLSQEDFIDGANRWLIPQWHTLYTELAPNPHNGLNEDVRRRLIAATLGWQGGLREYIRGLDEQNDQTVVGALEQISAAKDAQRNAWRLIDREQP